MRLRRSSEGRARVPSKTGLALKDPVGALARGIVRVGGDFRFGKPGPEDFVREAERLLEVTATDELREQIANDLYEDSGERYATEFQMAAFIYAALTAEQKEER
jgi:hypothetical protein